MKVADVMTREVHRCLVSDRLDSVAWNMWEHDCGALPVVDRHGKVVAMVTDRDVCMAAYTTGRPLGEISVTTAASHGVRAVAPDDPIVLAMSVMRMHRVRRLPVIDVGGNLVGMVSLGDITRQVQAAGEGALEPDGVASTVASVCRAHDPRSHPVGVRPARGAVR